MSEPKMWRSWTEIAAEDLTLCAKQADEAVKAFALALINQSRNPFGYPELNCTIRAMRSELANRFGADVAESMMAKAAK